MKQSEFNTKEEFEDKLETLPPIRRQVLKLSMAGHEDSKIAEMMHVEDCTIRRHITNACQDFGFRNDDGEHFSQRDKLMELFNKFKPDWVAPIVREKFLLHRPEPDTPGSPMEIDSPFYIKSSLEERCFEEIQRPGALVRIRSPQKTGKTSLLLRILNYANEKGYRTISLNLRQDLDPKDRENLAQFLSWFCKRVSEALALEVNTLPTGKTATTNYLQDYVLPEAQDSLVLALDEADLLFEYPEIAKDFFPLLRIWHNSAKTPGMQDWKKLRLVIVHSTDDYCLLDRLSSPFENCGYVAQLHPFDAPQVRDLAQRHGLEWSTDTEVDRLMKMVGGHPYLIQKALYDLSQENKSLDELLKTAPTLSGIYHSHLQDLSEKLKASKTDRPEGNLYQGLQRAIETKDYVKLSSQEQTFKLEGLGLVQKKGNQVQISCELYRLFFQDWIA